jgi:Na+/H+ antiporter NhaA
MQKIATRVFVCSSVAFGILGLIQVLTLPENDNEMSDFNRIIMRLLMAAVFIILPSFALSVAGKYLNGNHK